MPSSFVAAYQFAAIAASWQLCVPFIPLGVKPLSTSLSLSRRRLSRCTINHFGQTHTQTHRAKKYTPPSPPSPPPLLLAEFNNLLSKRQRRQAQAVTVGSAGGLRRARSTPAAALCISQGRVQQGGSVSNCQPTCNVATASTMCN